MENASKALLIAAGVLVGIVILSLAIYLMNMMGSYAANTQNTIDDNQISQFNSKFLKYQGLTDLNIQDVITVRNYALENNKQYFGYNAANNRAADNNDFVDVYYNNKLIFDKTDEALLMEKMDIKLTCQLVINTRTGKVNKVYFNEVK